MGTSSARPDDLQDFSAKSRRDDQGLRSNHETLMAACRAFEGENHWGVLEAASLLAAYGRYIDGNDFTARWVAQIAAAFRAAGGRGRITRLPDAAIKASLRRKGLDHDRQSVTFDEPIALGSPPTTGYTNDPVNTATGNFVEIETDLPCSDLIAGLTFRRTYNSRCDRTGAFGRGWSSWAGTRLLTGPDGASYVGPDGQEVLFPRMGDGYGRVVGVDALVEPLPSGLALDWFGGGRWEFDDAGRPVAVTNGPGAQVALRHDAQGRLSELAHAGGAHVLLQWDGEAGRVVGLACSDGRHVTYRYDGSHDLVEVDGAGGTRRYELDDGGRVLSVRDADGVVELVNTYDDDGRVLDQLSQFGRRTHLKYLPGRVTVTMDDEDDGPVNTYIHDESGRLLAIVDGNDARLSVTYDEWGNPVSITERNGAVTIQEWDERGRPRRRGLPTGVTFTFAYDDADRLVESASTGAVTRYAYSGEERDPAEIVDPEGGVTRQTVKDGLIHRIVDPDGVAMDFEFDADGHMISATDGAGGTVRLERDGAGRSTAAVTPLGRRTAFSYDEQGLLAEHRDPAGAIWRYEHTAAGRLASVTDPTGARRETRYGDHGSPAAEVDPLGHVRTSEYDVFGNVVAVTEPDGAAWRYTYDALMRLTATADPTGACWAREYDVDGTLVAKIDPVGTRVSATLDAFGRVIAIDDGLTSERFELDEFGRTAALLRADGTRARAEYDLCGRRTLFENASGEITRWTFTSGGRVARQVSASGRMDAFEYDVCGRVAARVDGAGRRWEYRYDPDGALVEIGLPTGEVESYEYDEAGRVVRWSAPGEGISSYAYDPAGRLVVVTDREAGASRFEYDAAGNLVGAIDANGAATRYDRDERGRVTSVTDPLGATTTLSYDAVGRLIEQTDQLGRSGTATYDAAGRLVARSDASGRSVCRSYDIAGRLVSFGPPDEEPTTIEYDALGQMIAIEEPGSFSNRLRWDAEGRLVERKRGDLALRWAYNADGERSAVGYPDGTETTYTHDAGGYVIAAQHPALGAIELRRDEAGRLVGASSDGMRALWRYAGGDLERYEMQAGATQRTAELTRDPLGRIARATIDGAAHEFGYDPAGQLVSASSPAGSSSFSYDANGRLAREESPSGVADYQYDAAGQLLARVGAGTESSYEYDAAGRRLRETGPCSDRSYEWDDFGRLHHVERADGDERQSTRVSVDALGELAALDDTQMLWDSAHPLQPLAWNGDGAVVGEGAPWALASNGSAQWLAPDWQGTVGDAARDPWGAVCAATGPFAAGAELGFRGELEFDGATWLRNRVYESASRSFSQPDALPPVPGTAAAANPYHYAANNPIGLSDPLGLRPVTDQELKKIRDGMDRNMFQKGGDFVVKHASTISAVTGIAAVVLSFTPLAPLSPFLAGVSAVTGSMSAYQSYKKGDYLGMTLDIAGVALSGLAAFKGLKAARAGAAMKEADRGAATAIQHARGASDAHLHNFAARKYAEHADLVDKARELSQARRALQSSKQAIEYGGVPLNVISLTRTHVPSGTPLDPLLPPQAPALAATR